MSEQEIIQLAAGGNEAALRRLLLAHHDRLAATIASQLPRDLRSTVSADDVLQETYLVVFRKIREFEPGRSGGVVKMLSITSRMFPSTSYGNLPVSMW